jgi:uncharacterized protein DUF326
MPEEKSMSQEMKECMAACFSCSHICNRCGDDMIGMEGGDHRLMSRCIRLCRDCADVCVLAAQWLGRMSLMSASICRLCAEVCEMCAETCEQHAPHHALCGPCAKECRRCADLCRRMTAGAKAA